MTNKEGRLLEDFISGGVPMVSMRRSEDLNTKLAELFEVSKRQIREWKDQKAIKVTGKYSAFMTLRVGNRFGVLVRVREL